MAIGDWFIVYCRIAASLPWVATHHEVTLPLGPEATARADALSQQIEELQRPVELHFRLAPHSASRAN